MPSGLLDKTNSRTAKVGYEEMTPTKSVIATCETSRAGNNRSDALLREIRPMRKVDDRRVSPDVLLAQPLTPEQEKVLYFPVERYRLLCTRILQVAQNLKSKVFLVSSAIAEEGKTLISVNLAYALGNVASKRTLLIEMDLRRPSLSRYLGMKANASEGSFLETDDWHESLWSLRPNLHALVLGAPVDRPDELLHSDATRRLLAEAREEYDVVLIDSAPLLLTGDTHVLMALVDHAVLVVRADHTPIACSRDALGMLGDKGLGCVLNDTRQMKYEEYYRAYYK